MQHGPAALLVRQCPHLAIGDGCTGLPDQHTLHWESIPMLWSIPCVRHSLTLLLPHQSLLIGACKRWKLAPSTFAFILNCQDKQEVKMQNEWKIT